MDEVELNDSMETDSGVPIESAEAESPQDAVEYIPTTSYKIRRADTVERTMDDCLAECLTI